jgi:hypothetical protein
VIDCYDDEVRFVLDQHAELDLYSDSSPKQQSADRHVAPLGHIILIPTQLIFVLTPYFSVLSRETTKNNFIALGLNRPRLELTMLILMICSFVNEQPVIYKLYRKAHRVDVVGPG